MLRITRPEDLYHPVVGHPVETIANLDSIPIQENGEPLVNLADVCPSILLRPFYKPLRGRQPLFARASVAQRLQIAQQWLDEQHPGYRIAVVDAHRSAAEQRWGHLILRYSLRLQHPTWPAALVREAANKYVAAPDAIAPPPHTTGGAIDVRLVGPDGRQLNVQGPPLKLAAARTDYPHLSATVKHYRQILCAALNHAGFSNYEEEWWHWSYGDSGWALRSNQPFAFYDRVERPP